MKKLGVGRLSKVIDNMGNRGLKEILKDRAPRNEERAKRNRGTGQTGKRRKGD